MTPTWGGGLQAMHTESSVSPIDQMKKVNKQCLLDTPRTVRVSEKDEYNTKLFTPESSTYQSLYRKNSLSSHRCHFIKKIFFSKPNSFMHMFNVSTLCWQSIKMLHQKLWLELIGP